VRWPSTAGPVAAAEGDRAGAVREDRVGDGTLEPVVEEIGGRADLHRHHERAMRVKCLQVVPRLLQRDHGGGAARVAHVHALHVIAAAEARDEVRVEARREPSRARRGGDEVHVVRRPPRALERGPRGRLRQGQRALAEARVEIVHALVRREARGIDPEMAALDVAGCEEAAPALVRVTGAGEHIGLGKAVRRYGGRDGGDAWCAHIR